MEAKRYERYTPFGAKDKGIFSEQPLGNEGLGQHGYQGQMQRRPFNQEVLALRSGASSVDARGPQPRGARPVVAGADAGHPPDRIDAIMRSAQYPAEPERQHFGKQQFAEGHQAGSKAHIFRSQCFSAFALYSHYILTFENVCKVGELMLQTPSNAGSAAGVQVCFTL